MGNKEKGWTFLVFLLVGLGAFVFRIGVNKASQIQHFCRLNPSFSSPPWSVSTRGGKHCWEMSVDCRQSPGQRKFQVGGGAS
jgi:hypothetical protein